MWFDRPKNRKTAVLGFFIDADFYTNSIYFINRNIRVKKAETLLSGSWLLNGELKWSERLGLHHCCTGISPDRFFYGLMLLLGIGVAKRNQSQE